MDNIFGDDYKEASIGPRRSQCKRTQTTNYIPSMKGKSYKKGPSSGPACQYANQFGEVNLCYKGQRYLLHNGVVNVNCIRKPRVPEDWQPPAQFADGVINLNTLKQQWTTKDDLDMDKHIIGIIMVHQYSLKKGIQLSGERAEVAAVKELKQIHDMETDTPMDPSKLTQGRETKGLISLVPNY